MSTVEKVDNNKLKIGLLAAGALGAVGFGVWYFWRSKRVNTPRSIFEKRISELASKITSVIDKSESIEYFTSKEISVVKDPKNPDLVISIVEAENLKKKSDPKYTKESPFVPPFENGIFIADLDHHRILANKFALVKYHILVTSKEFERQDTLLSPKDFAATYLAMRASKKSFCFYNGGPKSGASQAHRHMQVMPRSKDVPSTILKQLDKQIEEAPISKELGMRRTILPVFQRYRHAVVDLPEYDPDRDGRTADEFGEEIHKRYLKVLKLLNNEDLKHGYNLLWNDKWMIMVLRADEYCLGKYSMNSLSVIGSMFSKTAEGRLDLASKRPSELYDSIFMLI